MNEIGRTADDIRLQIGMAVEKSEAVLQDFEKNAQAYDQKIQKLAIMLVRKGMQEGIVPNDRINFEFLLSFSREISNGYKNVIQQLRLLQKAELEQNVQALDQLMQMVFISRMKDLDFLRKALEIICNEYKAESITEMQACLIRFHAEGEQITSLFQGATLSSNPNALKTTVFPNNHQ